MKLELINREVEQRVEHSVAIVDKHHMNSLRKDPQVHTVCFLIVDRIKNLIILAAVLTQRLLKERSHRVMRSDHDWIRKRLKLVGIS